LIGGAADMIASAFGAGINTTGDVLLKFGGAVDILTATELARPDPRLFLDYHLMPGLYMPNGCMATGGSGLNWFIATLAGGEKAAAEREGLSVHAILDRLAQRCAAGADGLTVLPYFLGEKTPIQDASARGLIDGLTLSHDIGHLWRAMLEAYAYPSDIISTCSMRSGIEPIASSSPTVARRAASGCRSSPTFCSGPCNA
jgi:xylulokinase